MHIDFLKQKLISKFETVIVTTLEFFLVCLVLVATAVSWVLFTTGLRSHISQIESVDVLLPLMQKGFAAVLIVVLGLELLETLKAYFKEHHVRLEVILIVAIIAVGRHIIQVDFEHASGLTLIGISALILALTGGYCLVKKAQSL